MTIENNYLAVARKQSRHYRRLGEQAMDQLEPEQLFVATNEDSNSIAIVAAHMAGNMMSRWTDFLSSDGEKPWRNRDGEFERKFASKEDLRKRWDEGWDCFLAVLDGIQPEDLTRICHIRDVAHTVLEAINREYGHYSYHVGQIVFAAKQLKAGPWQSLTIPKRVSLSRRERSERQPAG